MEEIAALRGYDVTISNVTDSLACLGVAGPRSRDLLQRLTNEDLSNKSWPFLATRQLNIAGVPTTSIRISYTGKTEDLFCHLHNSSYPSRFSL